MVADAHAIGPAQLTPGYFAGVMATGIVSISAQLLGQQVLAAIHPHPAGVDARAVA